MAGATDIESLFQGIQNGDRVSLGRAITLVESRSPEHRDAANTLLEKCLALSNPTLRFTISGSPGVGKSTFIERLGGLITANGEKLAVLAIDPSSTLQGGSILGDKTRMPKLAVNPDVFIRPTPAGTTLGGVADKTREVITLCEAAGYNNICVETVGVGQSEIEAYNLTDLFVVLIGPGGGDALQGIKKGIIELADILVINKADGEQKQLANKTRQYYQQAIRLQSDRTGRQPELLLASGLTGDGIDTLLSVMREKRSVAIGSGDYSKKRNIQDARWLRRRLQNEAQQALYANSHVREFIERMEVEVRKGNTSPVAASIEFQSILKELLG